MDRIKNLTKFHEKIGAPVSTLPVMPILDYRFNRTLSIIVNAANSIIYEHEGLKTGTNPTGTELAILRIRLIIEELKETVEAMVAGDIVEFADGLTDLDYVVTGMAVTYGLPLDRLHDAVHISNMTKTKMDENSKGGKGEGFIPPQVLIRQILGL